MGEPASVLGDVLCAAKSNGTLSVRSKCRTTESRVVRRNSLRGPRGARGATGAAGAPGATGPSGTIKFTTIPLDIEVVYSSAGTVVRLLTLTDAVTKTSSTSILKITLFGHWRLRAPSAGGAFYCFLQARINDADSKGGSSSAFDSTATGSVVFGSETGLVSNAYYPGAFSSIALFTGLAAGTYTPSVWGGSLSTAGNCKFNPDLYGATMIVEEIQPALG